MANYSAGVVGEVRIKASDDVLVRFSNGLGALGEERARKVLARGLNRTGGPTLTKVRREIAQATSAPMAVIRKYVVGRKAWAGAGDAAVGKLEYVIQASGRPLSLALFKPVETPAGVRVKIWGRVQTYDGAFMRGGRWPNRVDVPQLHGQVFTRMDKARLPLHRMAGPSLPVALLDKAVVKVFETSIARLGDDIAHELDRELTR